MGYCDMVWDCCSLKSKTKLQTVQNRCARRILDRLPGTPSAPLLKRLGWITLDKKRKLHKCVLVHKILNNKGPKVLEEMLLPLMVRTNNSTRGARNSCLSVPSYNTDYVGKSFFIDVARTWNKIPLELRNLEELANI